MTEGPTAGWIISIDPSSGQSQQKPLIGLMYLVKIVKYIYA